MITYKIKYKFFFYIFLQIIKNYDIIIIIEKGVNMKRKLVLVFLGVFLLCGCEMKYESEFTINEDKSMNIEMFVGLDDEMADFLMSMEEDQESEFDTSTDDELSNDILNNELNTEEDEDIDIELDAPKEYTDEERMQFIRESFEFDKMDSEGISASGFTIKEYQDDKYNGYIITKTISNIDNLVGTPDFNLSDFEEIDSKKIFTKNGNEYAGKIIVADLTEDMGDMDTSQYEGMNYINCTFVLNLPNKVKSSNATTVSEDGKTLTWNLASGNINTVEFTFEFPSILTFLKDNMLLTAAVAVVVVLLIVVIITLVLKKGKNKNNNSLNDVTNVTANEPTMKKTESVNTIASTPINQVTNPSIQFQPEQNQTMINQTLEQPQTNVNNQISTNQTMTQLENINQQPSIQPQVQNMQQGISVQSIPVMPISQSNMAPVSPQPINNEQQTPMTIVQDENTIPEIKPVVPEHINIQPVQQSNMQLIQQQVVNQQPNPTIVTNGFTGQNNIVQPQIDNTNININNQGI